VLRPGEGRPVACCDQVVAGVHAQLDVAPGRLGAKAALRALSDLAAAAAVPTSLLCALRAPAEASESSLRGLISGVARAGDDHGAPLVGGDITCAPGPLSLSVTALGYYQLAGRSPSRQRARPGQVVLLTGPVGGSRLGRHLRIRPRIEHGLALAQAGATALMDVSDGLAWDLYRLARTAGVRAVLVQVPVHSDARRAARASGRDPLDHALHDGEDHELIATLPRRRAEVLLADHPEWTCIGRVEAGRGLRLELPSMAPRAWRPVEGGWRHGG
ncbi:MAG: thiamine-phosphate kinase, partial [Planctomycetota bacterium]|nr:thiamine-phosphate kinase [Planctomycetota bacterium]